MSQQFGQLLAWVVVITFAYVSYRFGRKVAQIKNDIKQLRLHSIGDRIKENDLQRQAYHHALAMGIMVGASLIILAAAYGVIRF